MYGRFLRQVVYEDRVKLSDYELVKLCKYFAAHVSLGCNNVEKVFGVVRVDRSIGV